MAKPKLKALIVGAGGVTSYMLPALKNSFDLELVLIDGDTLEKKNLDRQLFRTNHVGLNKAVALAKTYTFNKHNCSVIQQYFDKEMLETEYSYWFQQADILIAAVDNHPARRALLEVAKELDKPCLVMANEYSTSQAFMYVPHLESQYPMINPFLRYPELATSNEGSPMRCQGDALESTPQLAIANQVSASLGNYLLYLWAPYLLDEQERGDWYPVEYQTTFSKLDTITLADLANITTPDYA
jgi:molybdopterin/thiamine biosynthesis adenylyltransferase